MPTSRPSEKSFTQSVGRAVQILNCFTDQQPELRVIDIARILGLTPSNVSRLLATLEHFGYVERDEFTGIYRPGLQLLTLAGIALNHMELRKQALAELQDLQAQLGLGANLAILRDDKIFYIAHFDGPNAPRMYTLLGRSNPLHATGMGKVLLAFLPATRREQCLQRLNLTRFTPNTLTDKNALREELARIRLRGYAVEREELALGRGCVAAPIRDITTQCVAAMSISGPLSALNLDEQESKLADLVREVAGRISQRLGCPDGIDVETEASP